MKYIILLSAVSAFILSSAVSGYGESQADTKAKNSRQIGIKDLWPVFYKSELPRMTFPLSWQNSRKNMSFEQWRKNAREVYIKALSKLPVKTAFNPEVIAVEDRGTYEARKVMININADCRIKTYLLVPKGKGPFPAVLVLHDHGGHFFIGKEKVTRPFDEPNEVLKDAQQWVDRYYGGHFIGDELAKRGYVVFSTDALGWGERGPGDTSFDEWLPRMLFSVNMNQLGYTWAGYKVWDDIRSAEFVQSLPEVNSEKIGCIGLSMGANRSWHLTAATDVVKSGVSICWMGDTESLANPDIKHTIGYTMMHPGLGNYLDYPDVASITCPKPMLFFGGTKDGLFPVDGVKRAYEKMLQVWKSQGAADKLYCKLWDVPHEFNAEMQEDAFNWLDRQLK